MVTEGVELCWCFSFGFVFFKQKTEDEICACVVCCVLCGVVWCGIVSWRVVSCRVASCRVVSCRVVFFYLCLLFATLYTVYVSVVASSSKKKISTTITLVCTSFLLLHHDFRTPIVLTSSKHSSLLPTCRTHDRD